MVVVIIELLFDSVIIFLIVLNWVIIVGVSFMGIKAVFFLGF